MEILYVTKAHLPTKKAYGINMVKTCEALADQGVHVTLVYPRNVKGKKDDSDLFSYYKIKKNFNVLQISIFDAVHRGWKFGFWITHFLFASRVCFLLLFQSRGRYVILTRDEISGLFLFLEGYSVFYDMHGFPEKKRWFWKIIMRRMRGIIGTNKWKLKKCHTDFGIPWRRLTVAPNGFDPKLFKDADTRGWVRHGRNTQIHADDGADTRGLNTYGDTQNHADLKKELRKDLKLPLDRPIVLYTGHLYDWKGADVLLGAARICADDGADTRGLKDADTRGLKDADTRGLNAYGDTRIHADDGKDADTRGLNAYGDTRIHADDGADTRGLLYEDLTYKIRGACFAVWKELRGAFKEKAVERALKIELEKRGLEVGEQIHIPIQYQREKIGEYIPDLVIDNKVLVEIKSKTALTKEDQKQFWLYLKGTDYKVGLLINFGRQLEIKRRVYDTARENQRVSAYREADNPRVSAPLFVFVGGNEWDIQRFKKEAHGLKNVLILGHKPHTMVPCYLKAADVLVLPNSLQGKDKHLRVFSEYDTSPIKLFEYMASGTPIVASDLPSIREVADDRAVFFVEPDNPEALKNGIIKALKEQSLAKEKGARALRDVEEYTWERRAEKILSFIERSI